MLGWELMAITKHEHISFKMDKSAMNGYYTQAESDTDDDADWLLGAALLLGVSVVALESSGGVTDEVFANIVSLDVTALEIPEAEISFYQNLQQELTQHMRIEDPKTIENKAMNWAKTQNDQLGMFGDLEAYKAGALDSYAAIEAVGGEVLIPWNPTGPNTCEDCLDKVDEGPYRPEDFPEPVHYGDQCNDPMADPIISFGKDLGTNIIGEIL
jgi:hypothetical protein